ncbi:MAG: hypothetical protein GY861_26925 [bacterium]|nr:hypothetical protein [bacterium]
MLHWRVEIADFETLGGSLHFVYNKGAQNHVTDALSRGAVDPPELTQAEEELWVASRALLLESFDSETPTCAVVKKTNSLEKEFHFLDTEAIFKTIKDWQSKDRYSKAGFEYVKEGKYPTEEQLYKWIQTVGDQ